MNAHFPRRLSGFFCVYSVLIGLSSAAACLRSLALDKARSPQTARSPPHGQHMFWPEYILLLVAIGIWLIGGAVIGFVVALLSRARSRVWVSLGGAFGTFFGMAGVLIVFAVLAAVFDIKSGGGHGGAQAGFLYFCCWAPRLDRSSAAFLFAS